jgi:GNAT superfamily N-acetyltransferase
MAGMTAPATLPAGYEFSADPARIDADRVHHLLAEHASWAAGRELDAQRAIIAGSRNYGIYAAAAGDKGGREQGTGEQGGPEQVSGEQGSGRQAAGKQTAGEQVAYARVVTDGVTFAWLADVIVDPAHRGHGLGRALVDAVLEDLAPLDLKRIVLKASEDGRPLYERAGWTPLEGPQDWMERRRP